MSSVVTLYRAGTSGEELKAHRVVRIDGDDSGKIKLTAAGGVGSVGVTGYVVPDAADLPVDYAVAGIVDVACHAAVEPGMRVSGDADGKVKPALASESVIGVALNEKNASPNDIIPMLIAPGLGT